MKPSKVLMSDVAKAAGVARVTVSRVLSDPDSVAPATRAAVQEAVAQLGYVPNLNAGTLASSRSRIVGAIVPTLSNAWFADTMDGLSKVLGAAGYQLLLGQTGYDADAEEKLVDAFLGRRVDAMVLTGTAHTAGVRSKLQKAGIPTVECWDLCDDPIDMVVGFSNEAAGEAVAAHLLARGRRRFGFLGADEDRARKRLQGYRAAIARAGGGEVVTRSAAPPTSIDDGAAGLAQLLAAEPRLQAVFCSNDTLALGALLECRRRGLAVPGELSVVGFSDLPVAAACVPPLTTVRIASRELGERAGLLLARRLSREPGEVPRIHDIGFSLALRESG
ncbi:LacI family DNA-binding transcriptional regulator [Variovorax rhizosphaerae]|uniref:LacI family DNA-binding transcriptional regulator n=1 Tax=Variovorax rhizosphaerae TaxID=1836200 RepID=A0ABU8WRJ1_9BURK